MLEKDTLGRDFHRFSSVLTDLSLDLLAEVNFLVITLPYLRYKQEKCFCGYSLIRKVKAEHQNTFLYMPKM